MPRRPTLRTLLTPALLVALTISLPAAGASAAQAAPGGLRVAGPGHPLAKRKAAPPIGGGARIVLPTRRSTGSTSRVRTVRWDGTELARYDGFNGNEYMLPDVDAVLVGHRVLVPTYDANLASGHLTVLHAAHMGQIARFDLLGGEHPVEGVDVVVTPDERYAMLTTYRAGGASGAVRIYDLKTYTEVAVHAFPGNEFPLPQVDPVLTPDGNTLLVPTYRNNLASGRVRIVDIPSGALLHEVDLLGGEHPVPGVDLVVTPDGASAVLATYTAGGASGRVRFIDVDSGVIYATRPLNGNEHPHLDVDPVLSPDGQFVVLPTSSTGGNPSFVRTFHVPTGNSGQQIPLTGGEYPLTAVDAVFHPEAFLFMLPTYSNLFARGRLRVFSNLGTLVSTILFDTNEYPVEECDVVFTPDGEYALLPTYDNGFATGHVWIIETQGLTTTRLDLDPDEYPVQGVDIVVSPDSRKAWLPTYMPGLATGRVRILDIDDAVFTGEIPFDADEYPVRGCDVVLSGKNLLVPTYRPNLVSGRLRIVSRITDEELGRLDFEAGEYPLVGVDVFGVDSPAPDPDEDYHVSGAVPPPPILTPADLLPPPSPPAPPGS